MGIEMSKQGRYSILEVEQLLGIPRTKIRYYMDRGLLNVQKDDQSGYYFYTLNDVMRICQIVYNRDTLGFSIEDVEQILETSDIRAIESITKRQLDFLSDEMEFRERQRYTAIFNREMIERWQRYKDQTTLVPFDTAYIIPYSYFFLANHGVYPISYGASEFSYDGHDVNHEKRCALIFEKDARCISAEVFERVCAEGQKIESGMCIYNVSLTSGDVHDPALVEPILDWANEHRFKVKANMYVTHFFPYYVEDTTLMYVESYLPIDL